MKAKLFLILIIFYIVYCTGCISNGIEKSWEGITGNTLRITISEFFPFEDNTTDEIIKNHIIEKLNQRASLIIACHITMNLSRDKISEETDIKLNKLIGDAIASGKMLDYECNENNYCSAHGEYNILDLQKNLELINNR